MMGIADDYLKLLCDLSAARETVGCLGSTDFITCMYCTKSSQHGDAVDAVRIKMSSSLPSLLTKKRLCHLLEELLVKSDVPNLDKESPRH